MPSRFLRMAGADRCIVPSCGRATNTRYTTPLLQRQEQQRHNPVLRVTFLSSPVEFSFLYTVQNQTESLIVFYLGRLQSCRHHCDFPFHFRFAQNLQYVYMTPTAMWWSRYASLCTRFRSGVPFDLVQAHARLAAMTAGIP